jgi:hypothetical protein
MAVNGKQKGNNYERNIANLLSDRFKDYTNIEKSFRRNPDSGAFFGGTNVNRMEVYDTDYAVYGDLICPRNFKFSVECKHYKSPPSFASIMLQKVTAWDDWLKKARQDASSANKQMILVIRYNGVKDVAFLEAGMLDKTPIISYNNAYGYLLSTVLEEDDSFFFE